MVGLTKTIAKEWGRFNIRCNAVAFGMINTRLINAPTEDSSITIKGRKVPQGIRGAGNPDEAPGLAITPLGRPGTVDEAAGACLMLASDHASYITAHCLEVTGGFGA